MSQTFPNNPSLYHLQPGQIYDVGIEIISVFPNDPPTGQSIVKYLCILGGGERELCLQEFCELFPDAELL